MKEDIELSADEFFEKIFESVNKGSEWDIVEINVDEEKEPKNK